MATRSTEELEEVLENTHAEGLKKYLDDNKESILSSDRPFSDYMHEIVKDKGLKQQDVFISADIPERYGYKLLSEEKRTRQRDVILRVCYAMNMTLQETQKALRLYGMPQLYAKIPRDAALMLIFNEHSGDIIEVNSFLKQNGFEMLRSSGVQE